MAHVHWRQANRLIVTLELRYRLIRVLENYDWINALGLLGSAFAILSRRYTSTRRREHSSLQIPLPPLAEQKRISGILDAAEALRAKRREALAQLDTLLQSTFLDMFGDPVTNPMGWEVKPLNELLGEKFLLPTAPITQRTRIQARCGTRMVHMANAFYGVGEVGESRVASELMHRWLTSRKSTWPNPRLERDDTWSLARSLNYKGSSRKSILPDTRNFDEPIDIRVFA